MERKYYITEVETKAGIALKVRTEFEHTRYSERTAYTIMSDKSQAALAAELKAAVREKIDSRIGSERWWPAA